MGRGGGKFFKLSTISSFLSFIAFTNWLRELHFQSRIDGNATYARPKSNRKRRTKGEKDCVETDVYVEGSVSCRRSNNEAYPSRSNSPRLTQVEAIREEEENEETSRITRF